MFTSLCGGLTDDSDNIGKIGCSILCNESCRFVATIPKCVLSHLLLKLCDYYVIWGFTVFKLPWLCEHFGSDYFQMFHGYDSIRRRKHLKPLL